MNQILSFSYCYLEVPAFLAEIALILIPAYHRL